METEESSVTSEQPRKLLRWVDNSAAMEQGEDEVSVEVENSVAMVASDGVQKESLHRSSSTSSDCPDASVSSCRREQWYEAKLKKLRETVARQRKEASEKDREHLRLKNKYTTTRRLQAQLQEELDKVNDVKLDNRSEVEFLRLQLIEREKEVARLKDMESGDELSDEVQPGDGGALSLECCIAGSFFEKRYLKLHRDVREKVLYGVFISACFLSVLALSLSSPFVSTVAVACWTLAILCLWHERKELVRVMKLNHLKQVKEIADKNGHLQQEHAKLEQTKDELETRLSVESREKDAAVAKTAALNEKIMAFNKKCDELAEKESVVRQELESERTSRVLLEQRLKEVTALPKMNGGAKAEEYKDISDKLKVEQVAKEKLSRENEKLIKEIVEANTNEERLKVEKGKLITQLDELREKVKNGILINENDMTTTVSRNDVTSPSLVVATPTSACWLCAWKVPRDVRLVVYVFIAACFVGFLMCLCSSKLYIAFFVTSLSASVVYSILQAKKRKVKDC